MSNFVIEEGTGVGKGQILAGIVRENYPHGRKRSIWVSASSDLQASAKRDLASIGAGKISVYALEDFKYRKKIVSISIGSFNKGIVFST